MFIIGLEMILGLSIFVNEPDAADSASIVPLAFPMIAGAGTLTTLISLKSEFESMNILIGIVVNLVVVFIVLKSSSWLERKIGKGGFQILRKVFGIILLSIAIKLFKNNWGTF